MDALQYINYSMKLFVTFRLSYSTSGGQLGSIDFDIGISYELFFLYLIS